MKERIYLFDNVKLILILFVVVGHFADLFTANHSSMRSLFLFIYSFHMPLFIFVSGLFVKELKADSALDLRKVLSFVSLGFVMKLIPLAFDVLLGNPVGFTLLGDGGPSWFMFALAAYTVLVWLFRGLPKTYVLAFSLALGLVVGYDPSIGDFLYLSRIVVFFPFFWLGYCLSPQDVLNAVSRRWAKAAAIVALAAFAAACLLFVDEFYGIRYLFTGRNPFSAISPETGWAHRLLAYGISAAMSAAVLAVAPRRNLGTATVFGSRTLQVYAWHGIAMDLLLLAGVHALFQSALGDFWFVWFTCLAIPVTLVLSLEVFGRPLKPFTRLDFGRESREAPSAD